MFFYSRILYFFVQNGMVVCPVGNIAYSSAPVVKGVSLFIWNKMSMYDMELLFCTDHVQPCMGMGNETSVVVMLAANFEVCY